MEHRQVGVEDGGILLAKLGPDPVAVVLHLPGGVGDRMGEPGQLGIDGASFHEPPGDPKSLGVEHERLTDGHTGRDCDSLEFQHGGRRRRQRSGSLAARVLVEVAVEEAADRLQGLPGIRPGRLHHQSSARFGSKRQHVQDALAINPL